MTHITKRSFLKAGCVLASVLLLGALFAVLAPMPAHATVAPTSSISGNTGGTSSDNSASSSTPTPLGGGIMILGYVTQDGAGNEIQVLDPNQKCQVVVKVRDERFSTIPPHGINFKLTNTASFSTPTMGDIGYANATITNGALEYAVVFNDIMYLGGDNSFAFDVTYPNEPIALQNVSVGLSQCRDPKQEAGAKPSLMVKQSSFGSPSISAGDKFMLSVTSFNTSNTQGVTDVTTSVSLPAELSLADGSNTVLHSNVTAGGSYTANFSLQALPSAEQGVANVTVNYTYYVEGSSDQLTSTQTITVPIVQPDRFTFMALDAPTELYAGEENSLTINFVNKGKGILYNLTAEISGNIDNPGQSQYLGNLNSGTEGSADFSIMCSTPGTVAGTITIIYEDVNQQEIKKTHEYSLQVLEAPTFEDPGMMPGMEPEMPPDAGGMPWWLWVLIAAGGIIALVIVILVVKRAKAKKRERELAQEDDDDEDF